MFHLRAETGCIFIGVFKKFYPAFLIPCGEGTSMIQNIYYRFRDQMKAEPVKKLTLFAT